jgi:3-methyladenine DNA glycosylase AlkD
MFPTSPDDLGERARTCQRPIALFTEVLRLRNHPLTGVGAAGFDVPVPTTTVATGVQDVLAFLKRKGSKKNVDGMARYGIVAKHVFGVSVGTLRAYGKRLGRDHELAAALWCTGWYEARMLAAFVDDPARVTAAQMDRWCRDFDNWAICDTVCFHLFDHTPHAWPKISAWSRRREEFVKRAAFALLASLSVHDKRAPDAPFIRGLALIERAATDDRNFVKKAVNWALRTIGRRNAALNAAALAVSRRLADSKHAAARWIGKDAVRELTGPVVARRLAKQAAAAAR